MTSDAFARLVREWQAGSADALAELVTRYSGAIRAAVRRRLHDRLRKEFDSLDFVQDVWVSVTALPPGRYDFPTPEALVAFLTRVAVNKVVDATHARFDTQRRDVHREEPFPSHSGRCDAAVAARSPTPSQWAIGNERWLEILGEFPQGYRAVLERLRDGYTHAEIARMTGVGIRTVERIVRRLKDLCGAGDP